MAHKKTLAIAGIVLALLNIMNIANSSWYFLIMAKFPVPAWLAFNACTPSVLFYLTGYFTRKKPLLAASLPFLLYFGTGGLFVFGWSGSSLYAQISHLTMTLSAVWIIARIIADGKRFKMPAAGFAAGIVLFLIILPFQMHFVESHPDLLKALGDSTFTQSHTGGK